jgi:hypothetical protein
VTIRTRQTMSSQTPQRENEIKKYQDVELTPLTLMIFYFADFARSFALMVANLPSSTYHDTIQHRKLAALSRQVYIKVNDWILEIGTQSFAHCELQSVTSSKKYSMPSKRILYILPTYNYSNIAIKLKLPLQSKHLRKN